MACIFDKPFKEQVEKIIATGDLKLLQTFVGIRNPIALLQYNSSFISTKINLLDTRRHAEYKVAERCLMWYKNDVISKDYSNAVVSTSNNTNLYSALISDASKDIRKELLTNILLPINIKENKVYDSISNSDYMHSSYIEWELVNFVRNTEINSLCCMNLEQINELYKAFVGKSKDFVQNVIESYPIQSLEQKNEINLQLQYLKTKISEEENEIIKYKKALTEIKDRTFLREWFTELVRTVKQDARKKDHLLYKYFPKNHKREDIFMENLKLQYPMELVMRLLKKLTANKCNAMQLDHLHDIILNEISISEKLDYQYVVERINNKLNKKINEYSGEFREIIQVVIDKITANSIMEAEQSILDDILLEAIKQEKVDSTLLLICNGANINRLKETKCKMKGKVKEEFDNKLQKPGFLVIEELYSSMPLIKASFNKDINTFNKFTVGTPFSFVLDTQEFNIKQIFSLEEIRNDFPEESAIKIIADSLAKSHEDEATLKNEIQIKEHLLQQLEQETLHSKVCDFMKPLWRRTLTVLLFGLPLIGVLIYEAQKSWKTRRNVHNEIEIAQQDLERVITLFKIFLEYLQSTVVAGSDVYKEKFNEIQKEIDIIKQNREKWVNLSNVLLAFESIQEASSKNMPTFITEAIKFNKLAEGIICNRMRYMNELDESTQSNSKPYPHVTNTNSTEAFKKKANDSRSSRKQAEEKIRRYVDLLRQLQNGDIPESDLKYFNFE